MSFTLHNVTVSTLNLPPALLIFAKIRKLDQRSRKSIQTSRRVGRYKNEQYLVYFRMQGTIPQCGDTHFLVYFPMRRYTFSRVFPHVEIHILPCNSWYGFNTLLLTYYCTCMNIHSPCIYLLLRKYSHVDVHAETCISACGNTLEMCNASLSLVFLIFRTLKFIRYIVFSRF